MSFFVLKQYLHLSFRLVELLHRDPRRAEGDLVAGEGRELMGLDVRSVCEAERVATQLPAFEVAIDDIDIDRVD